MNKILFITVSAVLLATLFACSPLISLAPTAENVASVASEIADFELPEGYGPDFTTNLLGYTVVAYNPGDGHSHLYLIQSEKESDAEKLAQMLADLAPASSDPNTRMTVIENRAATVRGQEATVVISEGVNHEGDTYRQATVAFQGKGGPALLVISEPTDRWDQSTVDAFLDSIK